MIKLLLKALVVATAVYYSPMITDGAQVSVEDTLYIVAASVIGFMLIGCLSGKPLMENLSVKDIYLTNPKLMMPQKCLSIPSPLPTTAKGLHDSYCFIHRSKSRPSRNKAVCDQIKQIQTDTQGYVPIDKRPAFYNYFVQQQDRYRCDYCYPNDGKNFFINDLDEASFNTEIKPQKAQTLDDCKELCKRTPECEYVNWNETGWCYPRKTNNRVSYIPNSKWWATHKNCTPAYSN